MRSARWLPRERDEDRPYREERPYLEAPSPYDRPEPPKAETSESEENPRVIVIEI